MGPIRKVQSTAFLPLLVSVALAGGCSRTGSDSTSGSQLVDRNGPRRAVSDCMSQRTVLPVDNTIITNWKSRANGYEARAHVTGVIYTVYPDSPEHRHFGIRLDGGSDETLEVVFNEGFGCLPDQLAIGAQVEACGLFVNSFADAEYKASKNKAIIHWIHNVHGGRRDPGFLILDGTLYGYDRGCRKN